MSYIRSRLSRPNVGHKKQRLGRPRLHLEDIDWAWASETSGDEVKTETETFCQTPTELTLFPPITAVTITTLVKMKSNQWSLTPQGATDPLFILLFQNSLNIYVKLLQIASEFRIQRLLQFTHYQIEWFCEFVFLVLFMFKGCCWIRLNFLIIMVASVIRSYVPTFLSLNTYILSTS